MLRKVPEDAEVHTLLARYYAQNKQMFEANLHMAYAAVYENNPKKVKQFLPKAKDAAKTPAQKSRLERFENIYSERKEFLEP